MDCPECDSRGYVDCKTCHSECTVECPKCHGKDDECNECGGDGEIECKACDGDGTEQCTRCKGDGYLECDKCGGKGEIIQKGSELWNAFLSFLGQHVNKKDRIISFLARKGGRYDNIQRLQKDISEVVNSLQIEDIQQVCKDKSDPNIEFIYEDEQILMVAVNFEGVKKYGSSYWCITQERDSFDNYANDGDSIQFIIYFKDKEPFVEEESVMGATMGIRDKDIEAAHWENDDEVDEEFTDKLFGKKAPGRPKKNAEEKKNILKGVDLAKIAKRLYRVSELNSPKYFERGHYVDDLKEMTKLSQFEELLTRFLKYFEDGDFEDEYDIGENVIGNITKYSRKIGKFSIPNLYVVYFIGIENCIFLKEWLKLDFGDIEA